MRQTTAGEYARPTSQESQESQASLAWVGLGSNLNEPSRMLEGAREALSALSSRPLLVSPLYLTPPWGVREQPDFLNQVVALSPLPHLTPESLLEALLEIERRFERTRELRWGPRTLDLDLLAWGQRERQSPSLCLPHPRIKERRFVLAPWCDLAPSLLLPQEGRPLSELLRCCPDHAEVTRLSEPSE